MTDHSDRGRRQCRTEVAATVPRCRCERDRRVGDRHGRQGVQERQPRQYVAIAAPGVDILVPAPDGGYQITTGTSVAAAHISGVVALLKERNPQLKSATA